MTKGYPKFSNIQCIPFPWTLFLAVWGSVIFAQCFYKVWSWHKTTTWLLKYTAFALWLSADTQGNSNAPYDIKYLLYIQGFIGLSETQVIKLSVLSKRNLAGERSEDWDPCGVPNDRERPYNDIMIVWEWNLIIWRQLTGFIAVDTQWIQQYYNNNTVYSIIVYLCFQKCWDQNCDRKDPKSDFLFMCKCVHCRNYHFYTHVLRSDWFHQPKQTWQQSLCCRVTGLQKEDL